MKMNPIATHVMPSGFNWIRIAAFQGGGIALDSQMVAVPQQLVMTLEVGLSVD